MENLPLEVFLPFSTLQWDISVPDLIGVVCREEHLSKSIIVSDAELWSKPTGKCRHSGSVNALCKSSLKICHMADCRRVLQ